MSLLRLLSAGRTLMGLKDTAHHYRVTHQRLLPKFGSEKNPFRSRVTPSCDRATGMAAKTEAATAGPGGKTAVPQSAEMPTSTGATPEKTAPGLMGKCASAVTGLFSKPRQGSTRSSLVQAELSLDRVTVIRNDLSDSDLEIVTARKEAPKKAPAGQSPDSDAKGGRGKWGRVGQRLLGAGKT